MYTQGCAVCVSHSSPYADTSTDHLRGNLSDAAIEEP